MILITINSNEYVISDRHPNRPITYVSDSDELEKYPNSFSPLIQHSKGSSYAACSEHDGIIYSVESGVNTDVANVDTYTTILTIKDGGNPRSVVVDTSASERFLSGESAIIKNGSDIFIIAMYVADTSLYCYKYDPLTESASLVNVILSIKAFQHSEELGILLTQHTSNAVYPYRFDNISDTFKQISFFNQEWVITWTTITSEFYSPVACFGFKYFKNLIIAPYVQFNVWVVLGHYYS